MQQQIDQLRSQLSSTLDNNTRSLQQQLGQMIAQVNERLKENAQVLNDTQQSLGERLDNAARVVGGVQKASAVSKRRIGAFTKSVRISRRCKKS